MKIAHHLTQGIILAVLLFTITFCFSKIRLEIYSAWPSGQYCDGGFPKNEFSEVQALRNQVAILSWQLINLQNKIHSLTEFREKFSLEKVPLAIPASILLKRDSSDNRCSFLIDKGKKDGVYAGSPVTFGFSLVGRVHEVGNYTSRVLHISDPTMKIGINLVGYSKDKIIEYKEGICVGKSGKTCELQLVEREYHKWETEEVIVITSGFKGEYPKGLVIGKVVPFSRSSKDPKDTGAPYDGGLFLDLPIRIIDLDQLKTVLVLGKK